MNNFLNDDKAAIIKAAIAFNSRFCLIVSDCLKDKSFNIIIGDIAGDGNSKK
jgi:hypothetical protein